MDLNSRHSRFLFMVVFALAVLAHLTGLLDDVFLSDSALYASIAKEMVQSNDFLDLTFDGVDWLDKPHFPFWITAISYRIFGINAFAYKFPAILFTLLAFAYTYKLARELYDRDTALLSLLILATAEHLVISNNDVRAEPYLTGLIIASRYYYHRLVRDFRAGSLLLASLFASLAVMTKGPFTLIPIVGAVGGELIIKRNWKGMLSWRWVLSLGLILLFILPELYALYHQFDLHPEKTVFGRTGVSGIRFFLWDSQFGRFFNTGPIKGSGDPLFFFHTLLWAFLPWGILMYYALYRRIRQNIPRLNPGTEFYTLSGTLLTLLVFSLSSFQLPHYTNIIFPLLAILTADRFLRLGSRGEIRFIAWSQYLTLLLMMAGLVLLQLFFRPDKGSSAAIVAFLLTGGVAVLFMKFRLQGMARVFYTSVLVSVLVNFYLNLVFYPSLLFYQSGSRAAEFANENFPGLEIRTLGVLSNTLRFHADARVKTRDPENLARELEDSELLVFTGTDYLDSLDNLQVDYQVLKAFDHFHTTKLTGRFLNHRTRNEVLGRHVLLKARKSSPDKFKYLEK